MKELLQKLLDADVLSEETKKQLEQAFTTQLEEAIAAAKESTAADVRAELTEQWIKERDTLIEAIDSKVGEFLETEMTELREDIDRFRDLEADYAEKLVEAKGDMANELKDDLKDLVEKIDAFLEIRLASEIEELREDIETVRKQEFGRKIFEAFADEFLQNYGDENSAESTLRETTKRLTDVENALEESERKRAELERSQKMRDVLAPLAGRTREVMEAILRNVDTENLDEGYKTFIGRVLRETSNDAVSEKEGKVLAEGEKSKVKDTKKVITEGVIKTGDVEKPVIEEAASTDKLAHLRKLAGIN